MAKSYRYKLNKSSHEVLGKLFFRFSPVIRRSGKWDDSEEILNSELFRTDAFISHSVKEIREELNLSDVLMQDICEYLALNTDIEIVQSTEKGIIQSIIPTKHGFQSYKFKIYLEKNNSFYNQKKFNSSAFFNNILTPIIAFIALVVSIAGYFKNQSSQERSREQSSQPTEYKSKELPQSPKQHQTNLLNLKNEKNSSYIDTLKVKK